MARLGIWLGAAFVICFLTGLISHLHQHPIGWLPISPTPAWAYRLTQGLHVVTGVACVPLLLAKLYAAYPRLFERPMVGSPLRLLERASIAVLVASSLLQVFTGVANIAQWYVFGFGFTAVHWSLALGDHRGSGRAHRGEAAAHPGGSRTGGQRGRSCHRP